ncbi:MAG: hypothetical protein ACKVW3_09475 [Phycisphaerales bacterium]
MPLRLQSLRKSKLEDFPFCMIPVMSPRAVETLRDLLEGDGEFVLADLYRGRERLTRYFVFNCLRRFDALDRERAKPELGITAGLPGPIELPLRLTYKGIPEHVNAFRCKGYEHRGPIVSPRVRRRLEESRLTGWMLADPEDPPWRYGAILSPHRP